MIKKLLVTLTLICSITIASQAQEVDHNYQHWYTYFGTVKLSKHWAIPFDVQIRLRDGFSDKGQILNRAGLQYTPDQRAHYLLGYAYVTTYSDGIDAYFPEHRIFQQFLYKMDRPRFNMTHRIRLEERWAGSKSDMHGRLKVTDWQFGTRFRYFNRTIFPLRKQQENTDFYIALQNEIFLNLWNNEINDKFIDQNRFLVTPGYSLLPNLKLEAGYMNQFVQVASGAKSMNHILHLSVIHNIN